MRTEDELRDLLGSASSTPPTIDVAAVVRRSRRRRAPRQAAVGGVLALAVAGIGVAGVGGLRGVGSSAGGYAEQASPAEMDGDARDSDAPAAAADPTTTGIQQAPASKLHLCGGQLAEVAPSETGLVLTPLFGAEAAAGAPVEGVVRLTNTGSQPVSGVTAASPVVTVSQGGLVLWHSNGPMIAMAVMVDLQPGESLDYRASFSPVRCEVEDDMAESFRDDLPSLAAGDYELSAAIDFAPATDGAPTTLVTGPRAGIRLR